MVVVFVASIIIPSIFFVLCYCIAMILFCLRSDDLIDDSDIEDGNDIPVKLEMEYLGNINIDINI